MAAWASVPRCRTPAWLRMVTVAALNNAEDCDEYDGDQVAERVHR